MCIVCLRAIWLWQAPIATTKKKSDGKKLNYTINYYLTTKCSSLIIAEHTLLYKQLKKEKSTILYV